MSLADAVRALRDALDSVRHDLHRLEPVLVGVGSAPDGGPTDEELHQAVEVRARAEETCRSALAAHDARQEAGERVRLHLWRWSDGSFTASSDPSLFGRPVDCILTATLPPRPEPPTVGASVEAQ